MLLVPVVQTMNHYQGENIRKSNGAIHWILDRYPCIYPVYRVIHLSHNWALFFSQYRDTVYM